MRDKERIGRCLFDKLFKEMLCDFEIGELRQNFQFQLVRRAFAPLFARQVEPVFSRNFAHQVMVARASPRSFQVDRASDFAIGVSMLDLEGSADDLGKMTNQFFNKVRHFLKIGVRPVGFEHGEFRIVFSGNAFVPEVAADLENLVEPAYEQTFQVKLGRDAQIKIEAERLVIGAKRFGSSATCNGLQNRRLYFQKTALLQEAPGFADNHDSFLEYDPGMFVGEKIEITLTVACFDI